MSQQINLYEARLRPRRLVLTGRRLAGALCVVLAVLAGLAGMVRWQASGLSAEVEHLLDESKSLQEGLAALTQQMKERRIPTALQAELDSARVMLGVRKEVVGLLDAGKLGNTNGFSGVFNGFSRQASSDLWLSGFSIGQGGLEIELRGKLFDAGKLPLYVQRLSQDPAFQGRRFAALTIDTVEPPVDAKTDGSAVSAKAAQPAPLKLPRHVEFVLRSELGGETKPVEVRK